MRMEGVMVGDLIGFMVFGSGAGICAIFAYRV